MSAYGIPSCNKWLKDIRYPVHSTVEMHPFARIGRGQYHGSGPCLPTKSSSVQIKTGGTFSSLTPLLFTSLVSLDLKTKLHHFLKPSECVFAHLPLPLVSARMLPFH